MHLPNCLRQERADRLTVRPANEPAARSLRTEGNAAILCEVGGSCNTPARQEIAASGGGKGDKFNYLLLGSEIGPGH